jgi:CubicO group peptidase (beta-lactamase class C family)
VGESRKTKHWIERVKVITAISNKEAVMSRTAFTVYARLGMVLICLMLTACAGPSVSTGPSLTLTPEDLSSELDQVMGALAEEDAFTGAVLVARNGEILLSQAYGWADWEKQLPNTPQTKFRIGSVTKQFTAMAVLLLQAEGRLTVQDHVCTYLPDCPAAWQEITIHHLLTHTSGIPNFTGFPDYRKLQATPSAPEQTIARFKDKPLDFKPGEEWRYSNSGYILLGYIIEQASGQSYETYVQGHIFAPLEMSSSGYDHNDGSLAIGYTGAKSRWDQADTIDMSIPFAAGALFSTIEDLYRWDQALYSDQFVSQETLDLMFTSHVKVGGDDSYGYGWFIGKMGEQRVISHGGGIDGFLSEIRRYEDDQVTLIVLTNRDTTNISKVADQIEQVIFEE